MKYQSFFPENVKEALKNNPPGAWMPVLPKECIRLSSGFPAPDLVPAQQMRAAAASLVEEEQDLPFHYVGSPRAALLQQQIKQRLRKRGIDTGEGELLITSGACQGIDLIARALLDKEAAVAVESPTYMEALEIFKNYTKQIMDIPIDENGLNTEKLAAMLAERQAAGLVLPRFVYTIPTFHNPTGTTMPLKRRKHLLELSMQYDFLIVEDDAYGELAFSEPVLSCKALDQNQRVLYVGSLSKVVAPGMRIGWIAGAEALISAFAWFKKDLDHPFSQATMSVYLENNPLEERIQMLKNRYQVRWETMQHALEQFLPAPISWHMPQGGYFVWVHMPKLDTAILLEQALAMGVSYIPGKYFFLHQEKGTEFLRLSFSYAEEQDMVEGVRRLGELLAPYYR